jgi:hypothetical protein
MSVCVYGPKVPIHTAMIASHLSGRVVTEYEPCDWMVFVYVDSSCLDMVERCSSDGIATLGYYVGSDAQRAYREMCTARRVPRFDRTAVVHERLLDELQTVGVRGEVVYFPVREVLEMANCGGSPLVAVYMPTVKGKYQWAECMDVAAACPEVRFVFYGSDDLPEMPENCFDAGRLSPEEVTSILRTSTAVLRLTEHDGCPQNIAEAKMLGRHVISNYPYMGCLYAKSTREAKRLVNDPLTHEGDKGAFRDWYVENCSPAAFRDKMATLMGKVRGNV